MTINRRVTYFEVFHNRTARVKVYQVSSLIAIYYTISDCKILNTILLSVNVN